VSVKRFKDSATKSAQLIADAKEICCPGAPHGLMDTTKTGSTPTRSPS
jgi:hypothetical protein